MNLKLRNFQFSDLNSIMKIENASFDTDAYPKKRFERLWKLHSKDFIVAELKDKIVGYIIAYPSTATGGDERMFIDYPKRYFIDFDSLAVDKKYRNLGIGKKLLNFILNKFRRKGFKKASLEVRTTNKIAASFYQTLGFKITKIIKNYYKDGGDAYRMEKDLIV